MAELLFAAGGVSGVGYAASRFQACEDNAPICFGNFSAKELLRMRSQLKDALAPRQLQHGEILPPPVCPGVVYSLVLLSRYAY